MSSTSVAPMDESLHNTKASDTLNNNAAFNNGGKLVVKWTVQEVVNWLNAIGFGQVAPQFQKHAISGPALPKLNDALLKEMGIETVGVRVLLINEVVKIQAIARSEWRNEVVWASEMYRMGPCNGMLPFGFPCPFESCTGRPDIYTLTNSKINIMTTSKNVNIPGFGCCGFTMRSDNIDLTTVKDVDTAASSSLVGDPIGWVTLSTNSGDHRSLALKSSQCQKVTALISNAKEEAIVVVGMTAMSMAR
mmetsp:Transcript_13566/g.27101  ORF Transcript_13566/g.27101 Transcript_13566/m.27101 type:complete len:248 (-) Transcript_13566:165-908(-)|eukprot:CAMPEP_0181303482 /NCGR_PEP_ID=MMETSP1101-20121128/8583_1 /TAXON_ID=46948 /ORGANISM="Rhodomonas abbreviata, Strain Caron Lab Isolate" /LENGTH=247 /DNA_ID=CAMNT_0023409061 /DNA_START=24 /DNA_END=767 /DNA_ORIENTATION=-